MAVDVWHAAKLRGVAFRAVGQEPGWLLEISAGSNIVLVTDYGASRREFPYVEPDVYEGESRTEYVVDEPGLVIELRGEQCRDTMSGELFSVAVTVSEGDAQLHGCGRALD